MSYDMESWWFWGTGRAEGWTNSVLPLASSPPGSCSSACKCLQFISTSWYDLFCFYCEFRIPNSELRKLNGKKCWETPLRAQYVPQQPSHRQVRNQCQIQFQTRVGSLCPYHEAGPRLTVTAAVTSTNLVLDHFTRSLRLLLIWARKALLSDFWAWWLGTRHEHGTNKAWTCTQSQPDSRLQTHYN